MRKKCQNNSDNIEQVGQTIYIFREICISLLGGYSILQQRLASTPLRWCHNACNGVSNQQPHDCLLNRLFSRRSKETSKLRVTGLCVGNSPGAGEFPAQMASNAENVSIWWRRHVAMTKESQRARGLVFRASAAGRHILSRVPEVFSTWLNVWNCNSKFFKDHLKTSPKR